MQTRLPRVPWWRPAALAAVAVPSIFFLTQDRGIDAAPVVVRTVDEQFADEIARSLMTAGLANTQLGDVRCQAMLCRIEASHSNVEAERKFIAHIGELEEFRDTEGFVERVSRGDGRIVTMVFVSRADRASTTSAHPPP